MKIQFVLSHTLILLISFSCLTLRAKDHPDILFIAIDDLNDWTSSLGGHPQAKTPNLDRILARGMTFTNAHCAAPACNPSRAALMSGIRPHVTGIYTNDSPAASTLSETLTLNRHFLANGYRTVGGGKLYHNLAAEGRDDTWTEWIGNPKTGGENVHNLNGLDRAHFDWGPLAISDEEMGDTKLTDWAIEELSRKGEEPLFLAVGYVKPHLPWFVPQKYFDQFPIESIQLPAVVENDLSDIPKIGILMAKPDGDHRIVVEADEWAQAVQGYLATVAYLDGQIGRLLDALDASERGDDMVIVLWSDHGWHLGEKEHWRKFSLWEEATRCVFGISIPGVTPVDSNCKAPVDFMSIYPTVCEIAELETPEHVKGPGLMPLLQDPAAEWNNPALTTHGKGNHGIRSANYRYIRYSDGTEELYDHKNDPMEGTNLADNGEFADIKDRLAKKIPKTEAKPTEGNQKEKKK